MRSKKRSSQSGITMMEVVMSIAIISIFILPIASYFTMAAGARVDSQSVTKATIYAENLINDIKKQIAEDVEKQRAEENNPDFSTGSLTPNPDVRDYVKPDQTPDASYRYTLVDYLELEGEKINKFNTEYETQKFAYEAVVWRLDKRTLDLISGDELVFDNTLVSRGVMLYNNLDYDLDYTKATYPSNLKMKLPQDLINAKDKIIPKEKYLSGEIQLDDDGNKNYAAVIKINYDSTGKPEIDEDDDIIDNSGIIDLQLFADKDNKKYYKVKVSGSGKRTILIDATWIHTGLPEDILTMEIIDENSNPEEPLIVQVRKNFDTSTLELDRRLNLIASSANNTVIERPRDIEVEDTYLIAVLVRDLSPVNGNKGKIIKKMLEIYSYDYPKG